VRLEPFAAGVRILPFSPPATRPCAPASTEGEGRRPIWVWRWRGRLSNTTQRWPRTTVVWRPARSTAWAV